MAHTEVYIQCITLIYYTHNTVHTEVYIQCITLIYYTHDMVHTEVYIQCITLIYLHTWHGTYRSLHTVYYINLLHK